MSKDSITMQRTSTILAALLIQSAWLSGQNILDLSVPMTTIETEDSSTTAAANAPAPAAENSGSKPSSTPAQDQNAPGSNDTWKDEVLWDDFLDSDI